MTGFNTLNDSYVTNGLGYSAQERERLGIDGLLPAAVQTNDQRADIVYRRFLQEPTDLAKRMYLMSICRSDRKLFYRSMDEHLTEYMPIVYAPTVAQSIQQYDQYYSGSDVAYISIEHPDRIGAALEQYAQGHEIDLVVCTDAEGILGIGDWGAQGAEILTGKLAVYTAAAGIDPSRVLPVMVDVGTNRQALLDNPDYVGNRFERVRGQRYDDFIERFVQETLKRYPKALIHWEDFGRPEAAPILKRYQDSILTLNDDIQGTGVTILAALLAARKISGIAPEETRTLVFGAGTAGVGIADQIVDDLVLRHGMDEETARRSVMLFDRQGMVISDQEDLTEGQRKYARQPGEFPAVSDTGSLVQAVDAFRPTVLVGTSTRAGAFSKEVVKTMASHVERPLICPISNPTELAEAKAKDVIAWTEGRAFVTTGTPSEPVEFGGTNYYIGQGNNALMYPGICFGAICAKASRVSRQMLLAAAYAISDMIDADQPGAAVLPAIKDLRELSLRVATAVAQQAVDEGLNREPIDNVAQSVADARWSFED
ncbi:NAD-dependent malic enzyme [Bifidobacterium aemilianum]|uniref:NAD-dependent malic enzyme n=1 Tax=Bifidobacterium aemilianum TaxID=2493120 RepID=A0A366K6T3_9BIFI|nr:NAD-dependent malic enzyme [Bifidobacterium aemilianum]RBP97389.1 NAD-dependent malic enzyme [Bifidobacterium aemilianum]